MIIFVYNKASGSLTSCLELAVTKLDHSITCTWRKSLVHRDLKLYKYVTFLQLTTIDQYFRFSLVKQDKTKTYVNTQYSSLISSIRVLAGSPG